MLPKTAITVTREINSASPGDFASVTETTVFSGIRRVVNASGRATQTPYSETGLEYNYDYLVYMEQGDAEVKIGDLITFNINGDREVIVKKVREMTKVILKRDRELMCNYN